MKAIVIILTTILAIATAIVIASPVCAAGEPGAPVNISVMELGNGSLSFTWEKGSGADNTSVVGKVGSWPEDRADGTTIYNDNGSAFTAGPYDLDFNTYYIRAWSENASVYSLEYIELSIGGDFMDAIMILIFVALAAVLLLVGVIQKIRWVSAASAIPWAITAYFSYQQYATSDSLIWEMFALFGLIMFVVAGIVSIGAGGGQGEDSTGQAIPPRYMQTRSRLKNRLGDE